MTLDLTTFDPVAAAGLVVREVRTGERDGITTRLTVARRTYATDQHDLWDAVTNGDRIPRWFLPVSGELEVGGRYHLEGNASGVVEECVAPERFAATWEFNDQVSWLRVALTPSAGGTTLEVTHEAVVDPGFWAQFGPGAAGLGWDLGMLALDWHLRADPPADPRAVDELATTPPGIAFVRAAAAGWAEAAVADGDRPVVAQEAAGRTIAFYTGAPET